MNFNLQTSRVLGSLGILNVVSSSQHFGFGNNLGSFSGRLGNMRRLQFVFGLGISQRLVCGVSLGIHNSLSGGGVQ